MKCWMCQGKGQVDLLKPHAASITDTQRISCPHCSGSGKVSLLSWLKDTWQFRIMMPLVIWYDIHFGD